MLPEDVMAYLDRKYSGEDRELAGLLLADAVDHAGKPVGERLLRCAAVASRGDVNRLGYYVDLLRIDWRDVIVAGEYEPSGHGLIRVRDLNGPIDPEE